MNTLPPMDPDLVRQADADVSRLMDYLRRKLAEGSVSPSRANLMRNELRRLEQAA